jgi:phytoene dehydrogenase-like protein
VSRVVVVGGGLGGCAAAVRLAKLRHEVTLVERLPQVGGAIGFVEQDGYRWDAGPHATALPAVLRDLFRKSGRPLEREADLVPVDPMREHRFPDGSTLRLPSGSRAAQLQAVDAALGAGTGRAWVDHVHSFAGAWDVLRRDWLERPYVPGVTAGETERLLRSRLSMRRSVARRLDDPRLRALATHHAVQGGHDPRRVPAWAGMVDYLEQNFGTWTFPGGFGTLAGLLTKRLRERRVTVLTGTTVRDLLLTPDGPRAVLTDAGPLEADRVVVAVDPRTLPALARRVRRTQPAPPPTVTHLGLTAGVPELPTEVVLHGPATITVRSGGTAWPGGAAWTLLTRGPLDGDPVAALAERGIDVRDAVAVRVVRPRHSTP